MNTEPDYEDDINMFYGLIKRIEGKLDGKMYLRSFDSRRDCPDQGVYFMFEDGEFRKYFPSQLRVTRVGTHAIRPIQNITLWERLDNHRGITGDGGNARESVLRRHVGRALIGKSNGLFNIPTWGIRGSISGTERELEDMLERMVTEYVGGMKVLWLPVPGSDPAACSKRAFIEENSIALLSHCMRPFDIPSKGWLGNYHPREAIRASGLWNVKHVLQDHNSSLFNVMEACNEH